MIKLGQLKKGRPHVDKELYGFRINIARRVIRGVKKADQKLYYDDWWNGRESGNPNFQLAPSAELYQAYIKFKIIPWPEYVKKFTDEINNNLKAQKALEKPSQYDGTVTLLCHCADDKLCHRSLVKQMVSEKGF